MDTGQVGRPKFDIKEETVVELRSLGFSWEDISCMLLVSAGLFTAGCQSSALPTCPTSVTSLMNNWIAKCQRLFDPATEYAQIETVSTQRILRLGGSTRARHLRTGSRCIVTPPISNDPKPLKFRLSSHVHSEKH